MYACISTCTHLRKAIMQWFARKFKHRWLYAQTCRGLRIRQTIEQDCIEALPVCRTHSAEHLITRPCKALRGVLHRR